MAVGVTVHSPLDLLLFFFAAGTGCTEESESSDPSPLDLPLDLIGDLEGSALLLDAADGFVTWVSAFLTFLPTFNQIEFRISIMLSEFKKSSALR